MSTHPPTTGILIWKGKIMLDDRRLPPASVRRYERPQPLRYTMTDLEAESGVTARTIRYYISQGLLQPAYGRGPTAVYDADHLLRLRYIQRLKDERLPLTEIKDHLNSLSSDDLAVALKIEMGPTAETWRHHNLHEDLEIVVRDRSTGARNVTHEHAFDLIVEYARSVLEDLDRRVDE
jgi:DNA-binding transcriptional MerR regulator